MKPITLREALKVIESGQFFSVRFITADINKGTGGQIVEIPRCRRSMRHKITTPASQLQPKEKMKKDFGQISTAVQLILEPHDRLRKTAINELKGYFTKNELTALVDSQNGVMLSPDFIYNKTFFLAQLSDFEQLESGISRHNADPETLFEKIEKLSSAQVYLLLIDISVFWETGANLSAYLEAFQ